MEEKEPLLLLSEARDLLEILYIINALLHSGGNITRASSELEMGRRTLYEFMEKHGISLVEGELSIMLTPILRRLELHAPHLEKYLQA